MSELLGPIVALGLADSLNPVTIAVAVLLAAGRRPVPRLAAFALGTGLTYLAGGLVLALGPAALLHAVLHPRPTARTHVAELVIGVGALAVAVWLATRQGESVARRVPGDLGPARAFWLGVVVTAVDLPTALMYFGAIALVAGAALSTPARVVLLAVFCVAYVAPLIAITVLAGALGARAQPVLVRLRDLVARWGHRVLAALTAAAGIYLVALGVGGLAG